MNLYIDQGNTRAKWRLSSGVHGIELKDLCEHISAQGIPSIECVWLSNVSTVEVLQCFLSALADCVSLGSVNVASVTDGVNGLKLAYGQPDTLGVDRWLGMLAARSLYKQDLLVVSVGTAITVDKVAASGRHLGGMIAPGWLGLSTVVQVGTANIDEYLAGPEIGLGLGGSTQECLLAGVTHMWEAFLECANRRFGGEDCITLVHGGDSAAVKLVLGCDVVVKDNLVLDGLQVLQSLSQK